MESRGTIFTTDWFTHNITLWTRVFKENQFFETDKPLRVLEIGTWEGRSACWLLQHVCRSPESRLVCIDMFSGATNWGSENIKNFKLDLTMHSGMAVEARFDSNVEALGASARVTKMKGTSLHGLATLLAQESERFDIIYIDGSHDPKDVATDGFLSWRLLHDNGILIFDDYLWNDYVVIEPGKEPKRGIDAFKDLFSEEIQIVDETYQCILKKKPMPARHEVFTMRLIMGPSNRELQM